MRSPRRGFTERSFAPPPGERRHADRRDHGHSAEPFPVGGGLSTPASMVHPPAAEALIRSRATAPPPPPPPPSRLLAGWPFWAAVMPAPRLPPKPGKVGGLRFPPCAGVALVMIPGWPS